MAVAVLLDPHIQSDCKLVYLWETPVSLLLAYEYILLPKP